MTVVPRSRLIGWVVLVGVLAAISYAAHFASDGDIPDDALYRWSTAIGGLVQYAIILVIVLALARGLAPATLGLRAPASWRSAVGWLVASIVAIWVIGAILNIFLKAGEEQGLVLGFAAVRDAYGAGAAVVVTAAAFGLAHGLVVALPVLTIFGLILGWLRLRTESLYPPIILHAFFNGIALIASVTV